MESVRRAPGVTVQYQNAAACPTFHICATPANLISLQIMPCLETGSLGHGLQLQSCCMTWKIHQTSLRQGQEHQTHDVQSCDNQKSRYCKVRHRSLSHHAFLFCQIALDKR